MFEGKTLIGIGCSHTFGAFGEDDNIESCHNRSYIKKIEKIGKFKKSINLALSGASNGRSYRIIIDYISKLKSKNDIVIIIGLTHPARYEITLSDQILNNNGNIKFNNIHESGTIAPYVRLNNKNIPIINVTWRDAKIDHAKYITSIGKKLLKSFIKLYFKLSFVEEFTEYKEQQNIMMMHGLLKLLNIEHYFINLATIIPVQNKLNLPIPLITFGYGCDNILCDHEPSYINEFRRHSITGIQWLAQQQKQFIHDKTNHYDHEGNQELAEYIFKKMLLCLKK